MRNSDRRPPLAGSGSDSAGGEVDPVAVGVARGVEVDLHGHDASVLAARVDALLNLAVAVQAVYDSLPWRPGHRMREPSM